MFAATRLPVLLSLLVLALPAAAEPVYHPGTTRKLAQLTGDWDAALRKPTLSLTGRHAGVLGTDLGHSFEHRGRLCFLFGDTVGRGGFLLDCLAFSDATDPRALKLEFPVNDDQLFTPLAVPGIRHGAMEVPVAGISLSGVMYVAFTSTFDLPRLALARSVMARSEDDGRTWRNLYEISRTRGTDVSTIRFLVIDMVEVDAEDYAGKLPVESGKVVLIWGSGEYRKSELRLACVPSASIERKAGWRYFAGMAEGAPRWSEAESDAAPLFNDPQIGEFSVDWIAPLERWVLLYNATHPAGVEMRSATAPWGPWSGAQRLADPIADGAFARWLHVPQSIGHFDAFHDPGKEAVPGGMYGPYLINRFTEGDARRCRIYYTLSTWNPYQVVLMRSEIGAPLPPPKRRERRESTLPGDRKWRGSPPEAFRTVEEAGERRATSFTEDGEAAMGYAWRWLPRDARNRRLSFDVSGGGAEVLLIEGGGDLPADADPMFLYLELKGGLYGEVVACAWGHHSNRIRVPVAWDLSPYDSANLKLVVIDALALPWGFVSVSEMALFRQ